MGPSKRKLSKREEDEIRKYVKERLKNADIAHRFDHIEYVVKLAKKIGKKEGANLRILIPAAYLHDISFRGEGYANHTERSVREAETLLRKIGFSEKEIEKIKETIISSSFESFTKGIEPKSIEGKVLRDADWLEAMGARGIARAFAFGSYYGCKELGKVKWNLKKPPKLKFNLNKPDPSPIYHFFSKLLHLKEKMLTKTGKKLAEKRHKFMIEFLKRYKAECEGKM